MKGYFKDMGTTEESASFVSAYEKICSIKQKYGVYHKTLFHLHTPASYDYKLLDEWETEEPYLQANEEKLINICLERHIVPYRAILDEVTLDGNLSVYASKKEWLSYVLLANEILLNDYEVVVVTDHNTFEGVKKLEIAVNEVHKIRSMHPYPEIIYGIEIQCADRLHVVGIFDKSKKVEVQNWLEENLIDLKEGTFRTSLDVIDFFKNKTMGISYIAHINSSALFSREKYLSGAYKKKLKESGCFEYIGVHKSNQIGRVVQHLNNNKISTKGFVLDNDTHTIDGLGENYFWIKSGKRNFKTLKEAFDDFEVSVSLVNEIKHRSYIKGVLIENGGFLKGKDSKGFSMTFSDSLNCLIGGRGTGKSTILQILDYALGMRVADEDALEFICAHGNIWILFAKGDVEYIIRMLLPKKQTEDDHVLRYFGQNEADRYNYRYHFFKEDIAAYAMRNHLSIYEIIKGEKEEISAKPVVKSVTLEELYDVRYSVNELVQTAGSNQIDDFIRQLMFKNKTLSTPEKTIKCRRKSGLNKAIKDMQILLDKRREEVESVIVPFNEKMDKTLRIVYRQDEPIDDPDFEEWLHGDRKSRKSDRFKNQNITEENAVEYLYYVCGKVGIISLLKMALNEEERYRYDISDFLIDKTKSTKIEQQSIIDSIFDSLITDENYQWIIEYLRNMVGQAEKLSLEFNINSRSTAIKGAKYKDVRTLSLGQKVVAMLDFIFGYGDFINDNRPILIDQPEDNLDSQYIYMNLVKQLREIKDKRQVIIATHNATIVTNAMADQVCVMQSDGTNGWVEQAGYPSEDSIKRAIVNYLEGGIESFKHKTKVYAPIMN